MPKSSRFRHRLATEQENGWRITQSEDEWAQMRKPSFGSRGAHVLIAVLTGWWTLGAVNLAFAAFMYFYDSPTKLITASDTTETSTPGTTDESLLILRERYASGEIDESEFEQGIDRLLETETIDQMSEYRDRGTPERS